MMHTKGQGLLINIRELAELLGRSISSLERDQRAGRLPAHLKLGGSKFWKLSEIQDWVNASCPSRKVWESLNKQKFAI